MGMRLTVAAFIVCLGLISVQPNIQVEAKSETSEVNEGSKIGVNLRSLFNSIANKDMRNTGAYRNILEGEVVEEWQAFDTAQETFRSQRQRHVDKQKDARYRSDSVHEKAPAVKRDTGEQSSAANVKNLFEAVQRNDLVTAKRLISEGLPVTSVDQAGETAAHIAARAGHLPILEYLLSQNASLLTAKDKLGRNILYLATLKGRIDIVRYLVDDKCVNVVLPDNIWNEETAVHIAAREGHLDILKYFLEERYISPNLRNERGETPAFSATGNWKLPILKYLVEKHEINFRLTDHVNRNLLFPAAMRGDISIFRYVLDEKEANLQIDWSDKEYRTVLHYAAEGNLLKMAQYLVEEKGASPNAPDIMHRTPLHLAAIAGHIRLVEYLYEQGADPTLPDGYAKTPLQGAFDQTVIKFLEEHQTQKDVVPFPLEEVED